MAHHGGDAGGITSGLAELRVADVKEVDADTLRTPVVSPEASAEGGITIDVLKIAPDELARQITLIDLSVFRRIRPEELHNSAWLSKDKFERSPNVVNFTRRFNHVSLWVTREILQAPTQAVRVERLIHFIKVAKRLHDYNNLHGLLATLSGLQSAPIYRLSQTWKCLGEKYVLRFERLEKLMSEAENYKNLREHLSTTKLPCIPYLGMYLTDLVHLNTHARSPPCGDVDKRTAAVIDDIMRFQQSEYAFDIVSFIREYLMSMRYSEDLLKLIESENYRISLEIEPKHAAGETGPTGAPILADAILDQMANMPPKGSFPARLRPLRGGHRKVKSLGSGTIFGVSFQSRQSLLLPDPNDEDIPSPHSAAPTISSPLINCGAMPSPKTSPSKLHSDSEGSEEDIDSSLVTQGHSGDFNPSQKIEKEGMLRRRTSSRLFPIKRQWVQLSFPYLYLFSARHGSRSDRSSYKVTPSYTLSVDSCTVEVPHIDKPEFKITLETDHTTLRFIADTIEERERWVRTLQRAQDSTSRSARPSLAVPMQRGFSRALSFDVP